LRYVYSTLSEFEISSIHSSMSIAALGYDWALKASGYGMLSWLSAMINN